MFAVGAVTPENFAFVGDAWHSLLRRYLSRGCAVLDIGCGSGRIARLLAGGTDVASYVGFDVVRAAIEWCRRFVAPNVPAPYRFEWIDARSLEYNPNGSIPASRVRFPLEDRSVDVAFAASVFTHLLEPDAAHYLAETSRVLKTGGLAVLSIHKDTSPSFPFTGTETRIDVFPPYFQAMASHHELVLHERVGDVCGQEVFVFRSVRYGP
jgi:SAM-dependent methyltransferase